MEQLPEASSNKQQVATSSEQLPPTKMKDTKWGDALKEGYTILPVALLKYQGVLELSNAEVVVLLNLLAAWWDPTQKPYIQSAKIATRMKTDVRSVQRHLATLELKGFIKRERSLEHVKNKHTAGTSYDMSGTVIKLLVCIETGFEARKSQGEK